MKKLLILIVIICFSFNGIAQLRDTSTATRFTDHFFTGFQVRQSFQTPAQGLNPALFQFTIPGTGEANWIVDAGLQITLGKLSYSSFTSGLIGEFHRNTQIDNQQYNYQFGYNFVIQKSKSIVNTIPVYTGNMKYIRDITGSAHSIATSLNISLYRSIINSLNLGRPGFLSNHKYTYQLNPSFEAQYQQVLSNEKGTKGTIVRPLVNLATSFAINKKLDTSRIMFPQKLIELALEYDNRYAIINSVNSGEGYTKLFKAGISYYFFNIETASASIGASYNLGSDPLNGLKNQSFWRFSLQFQL